MRNILLALSFFLCALFALRIPVHSGEPNEFAIQIFREELVGKLIVGTLYVDGAKIGATYENNDWCVKAGTYRGYLRTKADKKIVAGPDGALGKEGDFLIEIANAVGRDNHPKSGVLIHWGDKTEESKGCILVGAVTKNAHGEPHLPDDHPLRILRLLYYGTDHPDANPNKKITIQITDMTPAFQDASR